jgi:hypothetical protein
VLFLGWIYDVERLEVVVDVHAQARPRGLFVLGGDVPCTLGQIANVSNGRFDDVPIPQVSRNGFRLCGRLDDD